jgi:hypothetical protein
MSFYDTLGTKNKNTKSFYDTLGTEDDVNPYIAPTPITQQPTIVPPIIEPPKSSLWDKTKSIAKGLLFGDADTMLKKADEIAKPVVQPIRDFANRPDTTATKTLKGILYGGASPERGELTTRNVLDNTTLGLYNYLNPKSERQKQLEEKYPITNIASDIVGYAVPGIGIEKAAAKIPGLAIKTGEKLLPRIAKSVGSGALTGGLMGGVEGGFNAGAENRNILSGIGEGALTNAAFGGALGGVGGVVGKGLENANIFRTGLKDVQSSIDNYNFPQLREPQILPLPDTLSKSPRVSPDIPLKYQPVKTLEPIVRENPLILPKKPVVLGESPQGKFEIKPENSKLTMNDINALEKELNQEIKKIEDSYYEILKTRGKQGVDTWLEDVKGKVKETSSGYIRHTNSKNEKWYSDATKRFNKSSLNDSDYKYLAKEYAEKGYESFEGIVPPNDYYLALKLKLSEIPKMKSEGVFKNISDFTPQRKTVEPIRKYNEQMKQYNSLNSIIDENKPLLLMPPKPRNIDVVGDTTGSKRLTLDNYTPNLNVKLQNKPIQTQKIESNINSPSLSKNAIQNKLDSNAPLKEVNYKNIKTLDELPTDEVGLTNFIKEQKELEAKGLKINLQLFAEAQKRLQSLSKVYTNTFEKTNMFTQAEKDILNSSYTDDAEYFVKTEKESLENAQKRLASNYDGEVQKLLNKESYTGEDVDTLFGILEQEKIKARQTGDYTKVREIAKKGVQAAGREGGRAVQAFAKYTRTAEGKIAEVQKVVDSFEDAVKKQNPNVKKKFDTETSDVIKKIKESKTVEEREKILNNLLKDKKKTVRKTLTDKIQQKINQGVYDDEVEQALRDAVKEKYGLPTLSNDDIKFITETMDSVQGLDEMSEKYLEGVAKVEKLIREKTPASLSQKVASGAFISMLGNFTSPLKNIAGNTLLAVPEIGGNTLARGFDNLISKGLKTGNKTVGKTDFGVLLKGAKQGARSVKRDFLGGRDFKELKGKSVKEIADILANPINTDTSTLGIGDKFEVGNRLAFDNTPARIAENVVGTAMKIGDIPFNKAYFEDTLQQLMKVNKVKEPTKDMIETAMQVSRERTYKDENALSNTALKIKNVFKPQNGQALKGGQKTREAGQIVMNTLVPFAKTPANIIKRGIEYSPLGLVEGGAKLLANKGNMSMMKQREIVDRLTRGTIGTGLLGLGALGYSKGMITGAKDENSAVERLKQEEGILPDAIKIGNKTIDLKGLQPVTTPLIAGSRISKGDVSGGVSSAMSGITGALEQYTDMPMLQGIETLSTLISSNSKPYEKKRAFANLVTTLPKQYVPSIAKKLAYAIDPFERDLGDGLVDNVIGKLPVVSKNYPEKFDLYGNAKLSYDGNNSIPNTLFNPFVNKNIKNNPVSQEALRLNKSNIEGDMKNKVIPKEVSKDLGDIELTQEQQNQYQKLMGDNVQARINVLLKNPAYMASDDKAKAIGFSKALDEARNDAKDAMLKELNVDTKALKLAKMKETTNDKKIYNQMGVLKKLK